MLNRKLWLMSAALLIGASTSQAQNELPRVQVIQALPGGQVGALQQLQVPNPGAAGQRIQIVHPGAGARWIQIVDQAGAPGQQIQIQAQQVPDKVEVQLKHIFDHANSATLTWGGMKLKKTPSLLQDQLGLDKDKGLVVSSVDANSAADKAGLKTNDLLLKINGNDVPNNLQTLVKQTKKWNADQAVDALVLRKGKQETLKAIKLPEMVAGGNPFGANDVIIINPLVLPKIQFQPALPIPPRAALPALPKIQIQVNPQQQGKIINLQMQKVVNSARISIQQKNDEFSSEYTDGELKITAKGKVENGVATASSIVVTEGKASKTFPKIDDVPEQHRGKVQQMLPSTNQFQFNPFNPIPNLVPAVPAVPGVQIDSGNDA